MKKIYILIVIAIGIVILGSWIWSFNKDKQPVLQEKLEVSQGPQEDIKEEVILVIDNGEGSPKTIEMEFNEWMTAFDLLKEGSERLDLALETKSYEDMGALVEAIGDKRNGQGGKYWLYYLNNEMPMVSVDNQEIKAGDRVEFKFEESPF